MSSAFLIYTLLIFYDIGGKPSIIQYLVSLTVISFYLTLTLDVILWEHERIICQYITNIVSEMQGPYTWTINDQEQGFSAIEKHHSRCYPVWTATSA